MWSSNVLQRFPSKWAGVILALAHSKNPQRAAELCYQNHFCSLPILVDVDPTQTETEAVSETHPSHPQFDGSDWTRFIRSLCTQEPQPGGDSLVFHARFYLLPAMLQKNILLFLVTHRDEICLHDRELLIRVVVEMKTSDCWLKHLINKLGETELSSKDMSTCIRDAGYSERPRDSICSLYQLADSTQSLLSSVIQDNLKYHRVSSWYSHMFNFHKNGPTEQLTSTRVCEGRVEMPCKEHDVIYLSEDENDSDNGGGISSIKRKDEQSFEPITSGSNPRESKRIKVDITTECPVTAESSQTSIHVSCSEESAFLAVGPVLGTNSDNYIQFSSSCLKEAWLSGGESSSTELEIFVTGTPQQIFSLCEMIDMASLPDVAMVTACQQLIGLDDRISQGNCLAFVRTCLLSKLCSLTKTASRQVSSAFSDLTSTFPQAVIEGMFVPCAQLTDTGAVQCDLLCRLARNALTPATRLTLLQQLISNKVQLTETFILLLQSLLDLKVELSDTVLESLIMIIEAHSYSFSDNLKFAKFLFNLITKYGKQLRTAQISTLSQAVAEHKTFMRKTMENAIKKLNGT